MHTSFYRGMRQIPDEEERLDYTRSHAAQNHRREQRSGLHRAYYFPHGRWLAVRRLTLVSPFLA